jgi:hypothetical protein
LRAIVFVVNGLMTCRLFGRMWRRMQRRGPADDHPEDRLSEVPRLPLSRDQHPPTDP